MTQDATPTLGQRIDAVLEPLYAEAEQYRQTIAQVTKQQQALQEQIDEAQQGLGQIESRMAQVVRTLAQQEPVIAAVVGQPTETETPTPTPTPQPTPEPAAQAEPAQTTTQQAPAELELTEEPQIELCPEADAEAVGQAASLLDAPPADAPPQPDLNAAAQRAAEAAKQLRQKAGTN